jgi:hypothetical protein
LLLVPVGLALALVFLLPGTLGIAAALIGVVLYFAALTIRASDWS